MIASCPPTISIVGKSGCGKTTFMEALIPVLVERGYRIATIKHHSHAGTEIDQPGKDTWRHAKAGADVVVVAAPDVMGTFERLENELPLEEIACRVGTATSVDLVLTEGYKQGPAAKIEVVRAARSEEVLCSTDEVLAFVSDVPADKLPEGPPVIALDAVVEAADLVESYLVRKRAGRATTQKEHRPETSEAASRKEE